MIDGMHSFKALRGIELDSASAGLLGAGGAEDDELASAGAATGVPSY